MRRRQFVTLIGLLALALLSGCGRLFAGEATTPGPASFEPALPSVNSPTKPPATPTLAGVASSEPTLELPTETVTPPPEPTVNVVRTVTISVTAAYLRSGPGTDFEIVGLAQQGEVMPVVEADAFGNWLQVELDDGSTAWVGSTVVAEGGAIDQSDVANSPAATAENPVAAATTVPGAAEPAAASSGATSPESAPPELVVATGQPVPEPTAVVTFTGEAVDPPWFPCSEGQIKGSYDTWTYHVPGGAFYDRTYTFVECFDSEEAAQAGGYTRSEH